MTKTIQLMALDIDGTLLADDLSIPNENQQAIFEAREQGIDVILCTGRSKMAADPFAEKLQLNSHMITGNGSEIWLSDGSLLERTPLKSDLVAFMKELQADTGVRFWAASTEAVYKTDIPADLYNHTWLKFGFDTEDDQLRTMIHDKLITFTELEITNSSTTNLEINAAGVNKANALQKLTSHLNLDMKHVFAAGDSLNDVRMIKDAGVGVAMGNSQQVVKEAADWQTFSNNEAGLAVAIRKYLQ
ncbi:Cof-type HAD-IIB family hydrolase [Salisediminibacterium halotolerans]|uniref:Uncharacterized protein n=1 Tax=Salisediminibacterium halotolerans TaxID=517425 RepID=A0A1H9RRP3_9BACI|nr:Cof-type HAD-IIB family hydrolase [Salisediminibacterium haloalkalitolerans]SER75631.1 hypothetical protein SAMN05444126_10577 [Salisediminibacterium haloalkalitolerans]